LEKKLYKELEDTPEKWMLVLEILTYFMGLWKLDLYIASISESTQRSYKQGWIHFISFFGYPKQIKYHFIWIPNMLLILKTIKIKSLY
jgi:hypothetical protein